MPKLGTKGKQICIFVTFSLKEVSPKATVFGNRPFDSGPLAPAQDEVDTFFLILSHGKAVSRRT